MKPVAYAIKTEKGYQNLCWNEDYAKNNAKKFDPVAEVVPLYTEETLKERKEHE
jgi:hypothetical protein